jgi:hypothetical protein
MILVASSRPEDGGRRSTTSARRSPRIARYGSLHFGGDVTRPSTPTASRARPRPLRADQRFDALQRRRRLAWRRDRHLDSKLHAFGPDGPARADGASSWSPATATSAEPRRLDAHS